MRKRIVIITLTIVIILGGLGVTYYILNNFNKNELIENNIVEEKIKEDKVVPEQKEEKVEQPKEESQEQVKDTTTTTTSKNEIITKPKENNNTTKKVETQKKTEAPKTTEAPKQTEVPKQEQPTEPKKENIWDKLGMTEYQYYNEPMYKWEKVDFSVEKYGSEKACQDACWNYGLQYEPYKNGEVAFHCSTVNTASGKYLGEWFHTEELIR